MGSVKTAEHSWVQCACGVPAARCLCRLCNVPCWQCKPPPLKNTSITTDSVIQQYVFVLLGGTSNKNCLQTQALSCQLLLLQRYTHIMGSTWGCIKAQRYCWNWWCNLQWDIWCLHHNKFWILEEVLNVLKLADLDKIITAFMKSHSCVLWEKHDSEIIAREVSPILKLQKLLLCNYSMQ